MLDLFSGIGGFSLGLESTGAFQTVAFCEQDKFCQAVLRKHWPNVPIYDDVRTIPTDRLGRVDIIAGGFPCQPWSQAGQQRGAEDDRDLWPEMARLVGELRPKYLIAENVRGFVNQRMGLERSLSDLEGIGYQAVPFIIPACSVDAPHRRDRVWIVANAVGKRQREKRHPKSRRRISGASSAMADASSMGRQAGGAQAGWQERDGVIGFKHATDVADGSGARARGREQRRASSESERASRPVAQRGQNGGSQRWATEPDVGRVAHGISRRVDRLRALGNAVVPQVVAEIGRAILAAEGQAR